MNAQKVYPKDSLDRFGDDLYELLLSYLSFKDRFRCECVSKQSKRCIFTTQSELIITPKLYTQLKMFVKYMGTRTHWSVLDVTLEKCQNIAYIECNDKKLTADMLDSIVDHCHRLTAINVRLDRKLSVDRIDRFFAKFAKQLTRIELREMPKFLTSNLKSYENWCPNLRQLINCIPGFEGYQPIEYLFTDSTGCMEGKMPRLKLYRLQYRKIGSEYVDTFVACFKHTLKSLYVWIDRDCDQKSFNRLIAGLSQMWALNELILWCYQCDGDLVASLPQHLPQLSHGLPKLKSLELFYYESDEGVDTKMRQSIRKCMKRVERKQKFQDKRGMAARSSHTMNAQKVYPKDSLDRFGDDLYELLLSYLSFEDRFRYECLSKQSKRCIFTTQSELIITRELYPQLELSVEPMRTHTLELIITPELYTELKMSVKCLGSLARHGSVLDVTLEKCQNIAYIECNDKKLTEDMVDSIVKHCHRLTAINVRLHDTLSVKIIDKFFDKFAKQLTRIELRNLPQRIEYLFADSTGSAEVKMPRLSLYLLKYHKIDYEYVDTFVACFKHTLKSLNVWIDRDCDRKSFNRLIAGLSQMWALNELILRCYQCDADLVASLPQHLPQLSHGLPKLKCFELVYNYHETDPGVDTKIRQII
ncbi:unnamed protein product [Oppiella nova]|uniref:F-box domain-containing protein n=1 Tax=Oppiella nova TaxID=334625 RepID=A0A7R9LHZ0_9ACAR|nr:unnamed protein product [Oppiella nova]CAG2163787.1 unnamed protein product [Oppiella nova]